MDLVWEQHYIHNCSQIIAPTKVAQICHKKTCQTVLGLSNSFKCPKCGCNVCLTHRTPEEHDCPSNSINKSKTHGNKPNQTFLDRIEKEKLNPTQNPTPTQVKKNVDRGVGSYSGENSLRGSTKQRIDRVAGNVGGAGVGDNTNSMGGKYSTNNTVNSGNSGNSGNSVGTSSGGGGVGSMGGAQAEAVYCCPLCSFIALDDVLLQVHFIDVHPDTDSSSNSNNSNSNNSNSNGNNSSSSSSSSTTSRSPYSNGNSHTYSDSSSSGGNGGGAGHSAIEVGVFYSMLCFNAAFLNSFLILLNLFF